LIIKGLRLELLLFWGLFRAASNWLAGPAACGNSPGQFAVAAAEIRFNCSEPIYPDNAFQKAHPSLVRFKRHTRISADAVACDS